ncbi:MAG: hypothetical protein SO386_07055 [Eubacteriales bacterium]|nr:hypothetical protein [Eubacteriales bacterium]
MNACFYKSEISGEVEAVKSKSYLHRAIILAALSKERVEIDGFYPSDDVLATVSCVKNLGVKTDIESDKIILTPCGQPKPNADYFCGESGTTLRLLLPLVAGFGVGGKFFTEGNLSERPLKGITDFLNKSGADVSVNDKVITVSDKAEYKEQIEADGTDSSQFVSAAIIYAAAFGVKKVFRVGKKVSDRYISMTAETLKKFGVVVAETEYGFSLSGKFTAPEKVIINGDWSNSAVFLAAGIIGENPVSVKGLVTDNQPDSAFCEIIRKSGGRIEEKDGVVTAYPSKLSELILDCDVAPDLAPIMAVVAAFCKGKSELRHVNRLRIKESDRVVGIKNLLDSAGIKNEIVGESLYIYGGTPVAGTTDANNDHRIIQAGTLLRLFTGGEVINATGIKKSFPDFFDKISEIGGRYELTF